MRNVIIICLLAAVACLAWRYNEMSGDKAAADARAGELNAEIESLKAQLKTANARVAQAAAAGFSQASQPGAKPNWVQQRNLNWKNPLESAPSSSGQGRQRGAMPVPQPSPTPPAYLTDSNGRYWLDAGGAKHYVP